MMYYKQLLIALEQDNRENFEKILLEIRSKRVATEGTNYSVTDKDLILCRACEWGSIFVIQYLIEKLKITPQCTRQDHCVTPLSIACRNGHTEIVKYLLKHNVDHDVNMPIDDKGHTCLMLSVQHYEICRLLVLNGASTTIKDCDNKTAFHYGLELLSYDILVKLYNLFRIEGKSMMFDKKSYLHVVAESVIDQEGSNWKSKKDVKGFDPVRCVKYLIKQGIDVNSKDNQEKTAFHVLINNFLEMSRSEFPPDRYQPDKSCYSTIFKLLDLLIESGIDIDATDKEGCTALHHVVRKYVRVGRSICFIENQWQDISDKIYPKQNEVMDLAKFLLDKGTNVFIKDNAGLNPMYCSVICGKHDIFLLYLENRSIPPTMMVDLLELKAVEAIRDDVVFSDTFMPYLKMALSIRDKCALPPPETTFMNDFFDGFFEPDSVFELDILHEDYHDLLKLSILIYTRILGKYNEETVWAVKNFLEFMDEDRATNTFFPYEVKLANFYYLLHKEKYGLKDPRTLEAVLYMAEKITNASLEDHRLSGLLQCYACLACTIRSAIKNKDENIPDKHLRNALNVAVHNLYRISVLKLDKFRMNFLIKLLIELYKLYPFGKSLFHIITYGIITALEEDNKLSFKAFNHLVQCFLKEDNLDVSVDEDGATPLHIVFGHEVYQMSGDYKLELGVEVEDDKELKDFISLMLDRGLHIDARDKSGKCLMDLLAKYGLNYKDPKYRSLQCLAAEVVAENKIEHNDFPQHLKDFIHIHSSKKK